MAPGAWVAQIRLITLWSRTIFKNATMNSQARYSRIQPPKESRNRLSDAYKIQSLSPAFTSSPVFFFHDLFILYSFFKMTFMRTNTQKRCRTLQTRSDTMLKGAYDICNIFDKWYITLLIHDEERESPICFQSRPGMLEKWPTISSCLTEIGPCNFIEAVNIWRGTPITGTRPPPPFFLLD